ncbi:MAG TPA: cupin domain-containing protein [Blastocatellia bacterium]|nr:cupin domain-containing protein [Blastocatellia bacterium]
MGLSELIHPLNTSQFLDQYWEQRPVIINGERGRFAHLFSSKDIGRLLQYLRPGPPEDMMLVKGSQHYGGNWTHRDGAPRLDKVRAAWREGYTIVVNDLSTRWEAVARFAAALQADLHHTINVNLYYTPADTQAFNPHFDIMDVFVLQLEGSKVWEVRQAAARLPLADEHADLAQDRLPPVLIEEELKEGGVLYIPRGHVHSARTTGVASLHLTVGVNIATWIDFFAAAVSAARSDERFRRALPPGFFNQADAMREPFRALLDALPQYLSLDDGLGRLAEKLIAQTPPPAGDDLLSDEVELDLNTVLSHRVGVICRTLEGPGYAGIQYSGGKLIGPTKIAPALRFITEHTEFAVGSLAGDLAEREKLILARRLIREGLLEVKPTP